MALKTAMYVRNYAELAAGLTHYPVQISTTSSEVFPSIESTFDIEGFLKGQYAY